MKIAAKFIAIDLLQLPTEKLFCPVMFSSRYENLTFIHLEQRGQSRITETLTSDGFLRTFYLFMLKFEDSQPVMNPNLVYFSLLYILCAMYFPGHLELN